MIFTPMELKTRPVLIPSTGERGYAIRRNARHGRKAGEGGMEQRAMYKFIAGYLSVCALLAWGVSQASPWIASHLLLGWII